MSSLEVLIFCVPTVLVDSVFSIPKPPEILNSPIPMVSAPEALSSEPSDPSKSISMELPPPVFTVMTVVLKSATVILATPAFVPLPWLIPTVKSVTDRVRPSMPMKLAPPTSAFRDIQDLRSVDPGTAADFGFMRAKAKLTSVNDRPSAPLFDAGPLTPAKASTSEAPIVRRLTSMFSEIVPFVTLIVLVLFSKAKLPLT